MITPVRLSYGVLALTIILAGLLHLAVPLLVILFSYFALRQLFYLTKRKWLALVLFIVVVAAIAAAAVYFTRAALLALPDVAESSIPSASAWAQRRQIELPFTDFESLRAVAIDTLKQGPLPAQRRTFCQEYHDRARIHYYRNCRGGESIL